MVNRKPIPRPGPEAVFHAAPNLGVQRTRRSVSSFVAGIVPARR